MKTSTAIAFLLSTAAASAEVHSGAASMRVLSTSYNNLQACAFNGDGKTAGNDKYFWMSLIDGDKNVKGACLLHLGASDTDACCTMQGSTDYSTNYNLIVADPEAMDDSSTQAYSMCGKGGTSACPNYNVNNNEQGFGHFQIKDEDGNGLRKPEKFVNGGAKCGLTDKLGTCHGGEKNVWGHIHVGKGYCWQSAITLEHYCDGHFGYKCHDGDC